MKTFFKKAITLAMLSSIAFSCAQQSSQTAESPRDSVNQDEKNVNTGNIEESKTDAEFVLAAADGGMLEARLGDLALTKALSPEVKSFAQAMVTDHGKANEELKNLASKLNISIPETLSTASQEKYDAIAQKDGEDFDRAYAEAMVADHTKTIENFYVEANKGSESEITDWAEAKVPILEHHLTMAKKMYDVVKKSE